ncbi:hypothetical protein KTQ42_00080|uniref:hypothetical protein n=1 Tax=Noviherbaspirillum sp. L7-7A TaxID=2850560 RepID=UPI001C2CB5CF|nr:hypothetical protein [Noviherbaspirillum sp. L7-7A]MBV0877701.1 hypothetical protein [Noviherbaspirillum sp. L7-7A]
MPGSRHPKVAPPRPAIFFLRGLIPPFEFYEAIQWLGIVVILLKAGNVLVVLLLLVFLSCASYGLIVISEFIIVIVGTV